MALWLASIVAGLLFAGCGALIYQLMKQHGRLLLRLDDLEARLARSVPASARERPPPGLAVGSRIPEFTLPDLGGRMTSRQDLRGRRVLLVHWNPGCGYCGLIAPDLALLQADLARRRVSLVFVSNGDVTANRKLVEEHGLSCQVLLQGDRGRLDAFRDVGTPAAYLLDEQGRIAEPLAIGAEAVPLLVRGVAKAASSRRRLPGDKPLSESALVRDGLKAGTPAPLFQLPEINGGLVSLEAHRGRQVLLVFTDPHCEPCEDLAPHLVHLHEQRGDLDLVLVTRGQLEENRQKAKKHGFRFPVGLQDQWKLSKQYGIFATPVAFLIDESGLIAREVACGVESILNLAKRSGARHGRMV
jgi:peroxiredoxin